MGRLKIAIDYTVDGDKKDLTTESNRAIRDALDAVNGAATSFTVFSPAEILNLLVRAEKYLVNEQIPFSDQAGTKVTFRPEGPRANAYRRSAISTEVTISRTGKGWYLTGVERVDVWPRNPEKFAVMISDRAIANALKRKLRAFGRTELPVAA